MKLAYALCLFGGATALGVSELLLQHTGLVRLLIGSVGLVSLGAILAGGRWVGHVAALAAVALLCSIPGLDNQFMALFKSSASASVASDASITKARTVYSAWGRYAFFEVMQAPAEMEHSFAGYYNDIGQWFYFPPSTRVNQFREMALSPFLKECRTVAVVGAGGGRDVALARQCGVERVLAIEIEPRVVQAVRHELAAAFEHIYDQPGVEVHVGDARKLLARSTERFDAIMFWSVGGYPQLMLEPGNMIRTIEALSMFLEHLTERGVFIMGYDEKLDPERVLLRQYYATFTQLGAPAWGFQSLGTPELLLVAISPRAPASERERWETVIKQLPAQVQPIHPALMTMTDFAPVTDDRPYLAGNIRTVLPPEHVRQLFLALGLLLLVLGVVMVWYMLSHFRQRTGGRLSIALMTVSFLVGSNFILLEHQLVLAIFRVHFVYYDSLLLGVVVFLLLTGLGSLVIGARQQIAWLLVGIGCAVCLWWLVAAPLPAGSATGPDANTSNATAGSSVVTTNVAHWAFTGLPLLLFLPVILVSGRFFPTVFEADPQAQLYVFGMDALGAAAGALLSFFVPILMGMSMFQHLATVVFLITSVAIVLFLGLHRRRIGS
jgi:spermidine synthase